MNNADLRSAEVIKRLAGIDFPSVAEIGVYQGAMSRRLLYRLGLNLLMVDAWGNFDSESYKASDDPMATMSKSDWLEVQDTALASVSSFADRVRAYHGTSEEAAKEFDEQFDLVFLDAAHDFENVVNDIKLWFPKVVEGGWLGGHDYRTDKNFGVVDAVDDFCEEHGFDLQIGQNYTWFVRK